MQSPQTVDRTFINELNLYKMVETDFEKDSNQRRNSNANLEDFHVSVNSDPEFAWKFCTFSTKK
jgi:hypothetical protein